jgi:selenocysteine-specific elongation factor
VRAVVVGTAGHIDHGKTALVRRMTGIDTDRLPEERERGISIDLGFARLTLPSGRRVAIVDVPGHERFIKNMLAGATGIDLVLLVVAADEGVMPQTREHLAIVELLGVTRGVVALTKSDLVDAATLALAREEVEALLAGTPLSGAPVLPVSAVSGEGVPELLRALDEAAAEAGDRDAARPARLPIDRVFSVLGIGTVVTGTLWSGTVRVGDSLAALPPGAPVRVRQVQVHEESVPEATAGHRTALALHGVAREDLARGDWIVTPGAFRGTEILDVRLTLLPSADRALANRTRLRVHLGASEVLGRVVLFRDGPLPPGERGLAQLRLERPIVAARGDRIVLRSYSPQATMAGARVLDPAPPRRARLSETDSVRLEALESGSRAEALCALARAGGLSGIPAEEAALRLSLVAADIRAAQENAGAALVGLKDGLLIAVESWRDALRRVENEVRRYREAHPLREGAPKGELKSLLRRTLKPAVFEAALERLVAEGGLRLRGDLVGLPQAGPAPTAAQAEAATQMERKLSSRGFQVPEAGEVLRGLPAPAKGQELVRYLVDSGRAVKVTSDLIYPKALWDEIERRVREHLARRPTLSMAEFKEMLQVSRKYAVPLLEHLDRRGFTRREGDLRVPGPRLSG